MPGEPGGAEAAEPAHHRERGGRRALAQVQLHHDAGGGGGEQRHGVGDQHHELERRAPRRVRQVQRPREREHREAEAADVEHHRAPLRARQLVAHHAGERVAEERAQHQGEQVGQAGERVPADPREQVPGQLPRGEHAQAGGEAAADQPQVGGRGAGGAPREPGRGAERARPLEAVEERGPVGVRLRRRQQPRDENDGTARGERARRAGAQQFLGRHLQRVPLGRTSSAPVCPMRVSCCASGAERNPPFRVHSCAGRAQNGGSMVPPTACTSARQVWQT